jgi:hypothetical protein
MRRRGTTSASPAPPTNADFKTQHRNRIIDALRDKFSSGEIEVLAVSLGVDADSLRREPRDLFALDLVTHLEHRDRLHELSAMIRLLRPNVIL